jgi:hypothetical protein
MVRAPFAFRMAKGLEIENFETTIDDGGARRVDSDELKS